MNQHRGIALKLVNSKSGISNKEIINSHYKVEKKMGSVWYSTAIPISNNRKIDKVLFVVFTDAGEIYITADIVEMKNSNESFVLDDCKELIPENYQTEKKKTWLHIKNMEKVDCEYVDNATVYYTDGSEKNIRTLMHMPRINRAYYTWKAENDEENLI